MKTLLNIPLIIAGILLSCAATASQTVLIVSPHHAQEDGTAQFEAFVELYLQLPLESQLHVVNGIDGNTIATFAIPNKTAYNHPRFRLKAAVKPLAQLKSFFASAALHDRAPGAANVPMTLYQVARYFPDSMDIVLMNVSPLYDAPSQPGANMRYGHVPSDGFLRLAPAESPFGTQGLEKALSGKRIHWLMPSNTTQDSLHLDALTRFWHLYVHLLDAQLISFTHNQEAVVRLLLNNAAPLPMPYALDDSNKLEMRLTTQFVTATDIYQQAITNATVSTDVFDTPQAPTIGIEWAAHEVDLDIYTQAGDGEVFYFGSDPSREALHFKDILSGHGMQSAQYETVQYHRAVDLTSLNIVINIYNTNGKPADVNGTLRLQIGDAVYALPFAFERIEGNFGEDAKTVLANGRSSSHALYFTARDIVNHYQEAK